MAKCNTTRAKEVLRFVSLKTGIGKLLRSDGSILYRVNETWKKWGKIKDDITIEQYIANRKQDEQEGKIIIGITSPAYKKLEEWSNNGGCKTPCGCWVEPDGECVHGNKSWLLLMNFI